MLVLIDCRAPRIIPDSQQNHRGHEEDELHIVLALSSMMSRR
jgi:hypothetical protein